MLYIVVIFQNPTSNVTVSPQTVCISFPNITRCESALFETVRQPHYVMRRPNFLENPHYLNIILVSPHYLNQQYLNPHYMSLHYLNPWPHYLNPQYLNQHCLNISPKIHTVSIFPYTKI